MNPAQLLNPKAFAKEQAAKAKAAKRTPNYGMFTVSSFILRSLGVLVMFSFLFLCFHTLLLCRRVTFVACDGWCLDVVSLFRHVSAIIRL